MKTPEEILYECYGRSEPFTPDNLIANEQVLKAIEAYHAQFDGGYLDVNRQAKFNDTTSDPLPDAYLPKSEQPASLQSLSDRLEELKKERDKEMFKLEQELDIPYRDRWYNEDFDKRELKAQQPQSMQSLIQRVEKMKWDGSPKPSSYDIVQNSTIDAVLEILKSQIEKP